MLGWQGPEESSEERILDLGFEECVGIYPLEGEWKCRDSRVKNGLIRFSPSKWLQPFSYGRIKYSSNLDS